MKFIYQSILFCGFLVIMAPVSGFKYTFHNKTDVYLEVEYFYKIEKNFTLESNYLSLLPGKVKTIDTGKWCIGEKIIIRNLSNKKYEELEDFNPIVRYPIVRCGNKEWDIIVVKNKKGIPELDLVNHSEKNKNLLEYIGKPSRTISIGQ